MDNNIIYFYTGTGNSLWTARKLSESLDNTELVPLKPATQHTINSSARGIGLIFPVHIWGLPKPVIDFIKRLEADPKKYYFALAVNAGQVAATLIQLKELMKQRGLKLAAGFDICLPSNYIPWGGAITEEKQLELFNNTKRKIELISKIIAAREEQAPEHGPWWQNIFLSALYRLSFSHVATMDKSFWADEKCTGCRICEKICPAQNIIITAQKPIWQHNCEQCFACLQWCPAEAIQYGKKTAKKKRYHHPEVTLKDMLDSASRQ